MRMAGLLEVCADSVCSAVNAARGGADRIELCSALPLGGLSPDEDLFCMVRERVDIPVRVLLRPRAGDFLYDEDEFELLCCQAARFAELFAEYQNYPLITKQRLFYETMEQVLPDMKLYILDESTGVQTMLPLESFSALEGGN